LHIEVLKLELEVKNRSKLLVGHELKGTTKLTCDQLAYQETQPDLVLGVWKVVLFVVGEYLRD